MIVGFATLVMSSLLLRPLSSPLIRSGVAAVERLGVEPVRMVSAVGRDEGALALPATSVNDVVGRETVTNPRLDVGGV